MIQVPYLESCDMVETTTSIVDPTLHAMIEVAHAVPFLQSILKTGTMSLSLKRGEISGFSSTIISTVWRRTPRLAS